jgi:hypothetical protein
MQAAPGRRDRRGEEGARGHRAGDDVHRALNRPRQMADRNEDPGASTDPPPAEDLLPVSASRRSATIRSSALVSPR